MSRGRSADEVKKRMTRKSAKGGSAMPPITSAPGPDNPEVMDANAAWMAGNREVRAVFLYMLGNSYLASGDRSRAMDVCRTLQVLDENLARLLFNKIAPL